jgi:hypothetical protein
MGSYGISKEEFEVINQKKNENLYQVACLRLFEFNHKNAVTENVGNHPVSYF